MMKTKIRISETAEELKKMMSETSDGKIKEKLQALYWLKTDKVSTVTQIADLLDRHRITVQRWLGDYKKKGINSIIVKRKSPGRPRKIAPEIVAKLEQELKDSDGFYSYEEVQKWLEAFYGLKVKYRTVHQLVKYELNAQLKCSSSESEKSTEKLGIKSN